MNEWIELKIHGDKRDLETICAVMSMIDTGLKIEDYSDISTDGMYGALIDEKILNADKTKVSVSVYMTADKNINEARSFIAARLNSEKVGFTDEVVSLCETDWQEAWKKYYHPVKVGKIVIVPAWQEYKKADGEICVKMDPGMAFGTGTHETTRLALDLIQKYIKTGSRMLDVGCGSGILAICGAKLGAGYVAAYDIDDDAVKVAKENVAADGADVFVGKSDLLKNVDISGGRFDLIAANIVADIILKLLPDITKYLSDDGCFVASGIIEPRKDEIISALENVGLVTVSEIKENDWIALVCKKVKG